jgi:general secretion pathway protein E
VKPSELPAHEAAGALAAQRRRAIGALAGRITPALVRQARAAQEPGTALPAVLQRLLGADAAMLLEAVAAALDLPCWDLAALECLEPAFDRLPFTEATRSGAAALREGQTLWLVVSDPFDAARLAALTDRLAAPHRLALAADDEIRAWLARREPALRAIDTALPPGPAPQDETGGTMADLSLQSIGEGASPIVRLVHSTLYDALRSGASDVHLESGPSGLVVKHRLDGMLVQVGALQGREAAEQALSRLKVMSELDIGERRIPQDGRFRARALGREVDFRVSIMPSIHGEDAVVRVLDKTALAEQMAGLTLAGLGFDGALLEGFRRLAREPYGLLLVTGPTGSGKTTTLYAALSEIHRGHEKVVTIEDPVEYQLPGVLQIPVNEKRGLGFARGLRSILRHDPDRIMVGEIRDPETAAIAVQAALTGHLVLSSVHANNSLDVIGRFAHMDVDLHGFVSALRGVLAQRLLRVVCGHCARPARPGPQALRDAGLDPDAVAAARWRHGAGCGHCRGTGYRGRRAVGELLVLDDPLRELVIGRAPARRIREAAQAAGTRLLRQAALDLAMAGHTTLEEVERVTVVD